MSNYVLLYKKLEVVMNLEKLEDLIYKEKIELIEYPMQNTKASQWNS